MPELFLYHIEDHRSKQEYYFDGKSIYEVESRYLNKALVHSRVLGLSFDAFSGCAVATYENFNLTPDDVTVRSLLCAFISPSALFLGKQVHCYVIKSGFDLEISVSNTLLSMYANCSDLPDAHKIFNEIKDKADLVSWNAILTAFLQQRDSGEISVMNALFDMYVKCGHMTSAKNLFDSMKNPDAVSWSSLIVGYAQFGYGEEALDLFQKMRYLAVKPNQVTFVGVLTACSHVRPRVKKGGSCSEYGNGV
ncbi:hypothetical protein HAX54_048974 [Datura stramonium]|uniref:Pentatricopeptide repeat-containing protein n=1 Tax=Datura stramonium TaxID=4076 RepID=A0ABS8WJY8_DATST|nr:hypothetical protein [Datura stramonium]